MEKFQILFMICFGFLSVYNFIRDSEIHRQVGELVETRQGGMKFFSVSIPRTYEVLSYLFGNLPVIEKSDNPWFNQKYPRRKHCDIYYKLLL